MPGSLGLTLVRTLRDSCGRWLWSSSHEEGRQPFQWLPAPETSAGGVLVWCAWQCGPHASIPPELEASRPALPPKSYFWSGDRFPVGYIPNLLRFSLAYCFGISPRPSARAVLPRSGGAALTPPGRDALLRLTGAVILLRSRPGIGRTEVGRARFRLRPRKASPDDPSRTRCLVKIPAPTARYRGEGMRRHLQRASPALASSTSSIRMVHTSAH